MKIYVFRLGKHIILFPKGKVKRILKEQGKIQAIKACHLAGLGLMESKHYVERIQGKGKVTK